MQTAQNLYEQDFYAWAQHQAALLRQGTIEKIDLENLAEEVESMGKSEKRALARRLALLLGYLLKWHYQPEMRSNSWKYTIIEQRWQVIDLLEDSPSLKHRLDEQLNQSYERAILIAAKETGLDAEQFPRACPYALDEVLSGAFGGEKILLKE